MTDLPDFGRPLMLSLWGCRVAANEPVAGVTWADVVAFCARQLPESAILDYKQEAEPLDFASPDQSSAAVACAVGLLRPTAQAEDCGQRQKAG